MTKIINTKEQFTEEVLNNKGLVLVDFYATWCGPCMMLAPIIDEISEEYKDKVEVVKVNIDDNQELAIKYNIMSIPTLALFKKGNLENMLIGLRSKEEIVRMFTK